MICNTLGIVDLGNVVVLYIIKEYMRVK
jgi:hypothetical protein